MTTPTAHQIVLLVLIAIGVLTATILTDPLDLRPAKPTVEMTIPESSYRIFEHKDTAIRMTFFASDHDYYYLESIDDDNWIWTGTHQEFITQFYLSNPLPLPQQEEPRP